MIWGANYLLQKPKSVNKNPYILAAIDDSNHFVVTLATSV